MKDCISVRPKKIVYATSKQRSQPGSRAILVGKTASGRAALAYVDVKDIGIMGPQLAQFNPKAKLGFLPVDLKGSRGFIRRTGLFFYEENCVNAEAKDPEKCFDLLEYLLQEEGMELRVNTIQKMQAVILPAAMTSFMPMKSGVLRDSQHHMAYIS